MQFDWALYRLLLMKTLDWSVETLGCEMQFDFVSFVEITPDEGTTLEC